MHSARLRILGITLAIVGAAFVLTLAAPQAVRAQNHVQTVETSQAVFDRCAEQHRLECVSQSLTASLAIADQHGPATHIVYPPQPEEMVRVELQVPAALLRTLMEEESGRTIELHVPAALLTTLSVEGRVQMP